VQVTASVAVQVTVIAILQMLASVVVCNDGQCCCVQVTAIAVLKMTASVVLYNNGPCCCAADSIAVMRR
jgi:hypothetical protein